MAPIAPDAHDNLVTVARIATEAEALAANLTLTLAGLSLHHPDATTDPDGLIRRASLARDHLHRLTSELWESVGVLADHDLNDDDLDQLARAVGLGKDGDR